MDWTQDSVPQGHSCGSLRRNLGGARASARLPGVPFLHLESCQAPPTHSVGPQTQGSLQPRLSTLGDITGGKGQHRGWCDLRSAGPLMVGYKLQRVRARVGLRGGHRMDWQLVYIWA